MGQCVSSGGAASATAAAAPPVKAATALVLLPTGELREYPRPTTAARVLNDIDSAREEWFLCDSDRMGFEGAVAAVGGADELRAGRIYFVLPAEARRRGLTREEVAALAVKAADALAKAASVGGGRRRRGGAAVAPLIVFSTAEEEDEEEEQETVDAAARKAVLEAKQRRMKPQRRFAPDLTAIPEGDMSE